MMYSINDAQNSAANRASNTNQVRVLMRILDWQVISVEAKGIATDAENAQKDLQSVKIGMAENLPPDAPVEAQEGKGQGARQDAIDENVSPRQQAEIDKAASEESELLKRCAPPRRILVKILLTVMDFATYQNLTVPSLSLTTEEGSFQGRRAELNTKETSDASKKRIAKYIKKNIIYHPAAKKYEIAFNTNEFADFSLDPDNIALEVNANSTSALADPKLVSYSEQSRYAVPGTSGEQETRSTQNLADVAGNDLKTLVGKVKEKVQDKVFSKAEKEVIKRIETQSRTMNCGTSYIDIKSLDPTQQKGTVTPGQDGASMGSKMAEINLSKEYENASKKIKYAMAPFAIDYKGWKPNILGKFFASDSNIKVETWKKSTAPYGELLVKMATAIGALKAFQLAIESTGIREKLEDVTQKLAEKERISNISQDSTIIANQGYNASASGTSVVNDIDRFIRK